MQNSCDYRYMSPPVTISLFYSPWFLPQKIGSRIRGLCGETFLGPILLNQQMWIIGMTLTSTTTFSCLVASRAFGDLSNISEKSCASLISWCALVLFAPHWVWKASFTPALLGQMWHSQAEAAGHGSQQLALPPCHLPHGHKCMEIPCWLQSPWGLVPPGVNHMEPYRPSGIFQKDPGVQNNMTP